MYAKDPIVLLQTLDEKTISRMLSQIKGLARTPPEGVTYPIKGSRDKRRYLCCGPWYIVYRYATFKGEGVLYVTNILTDEGMKEVFHVF